MRRIGLISALWVAGVTACGTQHPRFSTGADPGNRSGNLSSQTGISTRRVWTGGDVDFLGSPSPDGKLLSFAEWSTGNLAVRDLATGQTRSVTRKRSWAESNSYAENSALAPDGRRIAYSWANDSANQQYELRVIDVAGAGAGVLVASEDIVYFGPPTWSPSGREIAVGIQRGDKTWQLALISAETGAVKALKSLDWRGIWKLAFSPDGRFLAYDFPPDDDSRANEVYVIATDGSRETRVTNHPSHDQVAGWSPGGGHLLFFSDRDGTEGVWAVPVTDGRASGEPILVRRDLWHAEPIGPSRSGFFYGVTTENRSLFVAAVDLERAQTIAAPTALSTRQTPWPLTDWSPDGQSIAFGIASSRPRHRTSNIGIRTLASDEVREIPTALDRAPNRVRWSPDGNSLVTAAPQRGQYGIFRIDLRTGRTERLVSSDGGGVRQPEVSSDGRTLYFRRGAPNGGGPSLVARDLATGAERVICHCGSESLALSPNGRTVAFISSLDRSRGVLVNTIRVVPAGGGEPRVVWEPRGSSEVVGIIGGLAWSKDSRHLLFVRGSSEPTANQHELMVMPAGGGEPRRLFAAPSILGIRMHPDGRRILFTGGEFKGEVWVMENLSVAIQSPSSK